MIFSEYGKTGKQVSAIGFGGMRFTNAADIDGNAGLIKKAYDTGINYFDTAPIYCDDKSEEIFGAALKEMVKSRDEKPFYVSTKSGKDKPEEVRKDIEKSLKRLGLDSIDFYHYWCILTLDEYYKRKENRVLKEFEKLKEEGLIKHICVSTHMAGDDIGTMLDDYSFDGILLGYSAMNFAYREKGLDFASQKYLGVVAMNPLGGGIIPRNPELFDFVKSRNDENVIEGALRFLFNDERINVALVGFNNEKELREAVKAVEGFEPIPSESLENIRRGIKEAFNELCTGCQYCDKCPLRIPVPKMMDSYNQLMLGNSDDMLGRLKWHWGIELKDNPAGKCSECGLCERICTQQLPIRKRLREMNEKVQQHLAKQQSKR